MCSCCILVQWETWSTNEAIHTVSIVYVHNRFGIWQRSIFAVFSLSPFSCYSVERRAFAKTNFIERNFTIKCQLVYTLTIIIILFLVAFFSSIWIFLSLQFFFTFYRIFFSASFSILSPRIIFTSVINKSELWTFFTDCAAAWWCQSYCLLDASTVMSWRCALFCVVALCNGFCCCYVSFTGNMGKLMRMKFIRKSYVILLYLNTYKDDCLDFAVITLLWHWLLHYTHFILCVCVCVCDDAHKSAL